MTTSYDELLSQATAKLRFERDQAIAEVASLRAELEEAQRQRDDNMESGLGLLRENRDLRAEMRNAQGAEKVIRGAYEDAYAEAKGFEREVTSLRAECDEWRQIAADNEAEFRRLGAALAAHHGGSDMADPEFVGKNMAACAACNPE